MLEFREREGTENALDLYQGNRRVGAVWKGPGRWCWSLFWPDGAGALETGSTDDAHTASRNLTRAWASRYGREAFNARTCPTCRQTLPPVRPHNIYDVTDADG